MRIIICEDRRADYGWLNATDTPGIVRDFLPPDIAPHLQACGIEKTILVQCAETVAETEFLLVSQLTHRSSRLVGWVDLASREAPDTIAAWRRTDLEGSSADAARLAEDDWILRPDLSPALTAMKRTDFASMC